MATGTKYNAFTVDLTAAKHDFSAHTYKVALTNTAPNAATHAVYADITDLSTANGYTAGGATTTVTRSNSSGVESIFCSDVTWSFTGAVTFRYVVVYNFSQSSPVKPLVGYYDYGSAITTANGDSFTSDFDGTLGFIQVG